MKRWLAAVLAALLCLTLAACQRTAPQGGSDPDLPDPGQEEMRLPVFALEFRGVQNGAGMEALQALDPMAALLRSELEEAGYVFDSVRVTVGGSGRTTGEALTEGTIHAAVVNIETYALYCQGLPVLMSAPPEAYLLDSDRWTLTEAVPDQPSLPISICTSDPSLSGASFEELARAVWALPRGSRILDYVDLWLWDTFDGKTLDDLPHIRYYESDQEALDGVAGGSCGVVALCCREVTGSGLTVLAETERFYDTVLVLGDQDQDLQTAAFQAALQEAVSDIARTQEGEALFRQLGVPSHPFPVEEFDGAFLQRMLECNGGVFTCATWE